MFWTVSTRSFALRGFSSNSSSYSPCLWEVLPWRLQDEPEEEEGTSGEQWAQQQWDLLLSLPPRALLPTALFCAVLCAHEVVNLQLFCVEDCQETLKAIQLVFASEKGKEIV